MIKYFDTIIPEKIVIPELVLSIIALYYKGYKNLYKGKIKKK